MSETSALPETGILPGENPVEQLALIPDAPLKLETGWVTLAELAREVVPEATKQLTDSIRRFGLLQPILIRKMTRMVTTTDGRDLPGIEYAVVDGRRRLDACRKIGIDPVPVMVAETDLAIADVATLATNATRTSSPIAEYDSIDRLIHMGATIKDISGATGMSQQTIKARQRLFNLDPTLLDGFRAGKVTVSVAQAAAKLPKQIQRELAVAYFADGKVTMTDVHGARQARNQQAMAQMEPFVFPEEVATPEDAGATSDEPPEFDQANRLTALADEIDPAQGTIIRSLHWCAAILMDIATGQRKEPSVYEQPTPPFPERGLPVVVDPRMPEGAWMVADGKNTVYSTGQGVPSDATPNDAEVEEPNRVFTVNKIEEPKGFPPILMYGPHNARDWEGNEFTVVYTEGEAQEPEDEEPEGMDTSDQEPYPAEQADDERHPGNWMNEVFER